jgi:hypothetical protein
MQMIFSNMLYVFSKAIAFGVSVHLVRCLGRLQGGVFCSYETEKEKVQKRGFKIQA